MTGTATGEREVRMGGAEISESSVCLCVCKSSNVRSDQLTDDLRELTYRDEVTSDLQFYSVLISGVCSCFWALWGPVGAQCEATVSWMKREFVPLLDICRLLFVTIFN